MAQETLGTFALGGDVVEVATSVFLGARGVGVTRRPKDRLNEPGSCDVVHSFDELERLLFGGGDDEAEAADGAG